MRSHRHGRSYWRTGRVAANRTGTDDVFFRRHCPSSHNRLLDLLQSEGAPMGVGGIVTLVLVVCVGSLVLAVGAVLRARRGVMTPLHWAYLAVGVPWGLIFASGAAMTSPPSPPPLTFAVYIGLAIFWPVIALAGLAGWFGVVEGGRAIHENTSIANHLYVVYMFVSDCYLAIIVAVFVLRTFLIPSLRALLRQFRPPRGSRQANE